MGPETHIMVKVDDLILNKVNQSGSYWDIFNNSWGIAIIACNLVLFRVGRLINLKILSAKMNT